MRLIVLVGDLSEQGGCTTIIVVGNVVVVSSAMRRRVLIVVLLRRELSAGSVGRERGRLLLLLGKRRLGNAEVQQVVRRRVGSETWIKLVSAERGRASSAEVGKAVRSGAGRAIG